MNPGFRPDKPREHACDADEDYLSEDPEVSRKIVDLPDMSGYIYDPFSHTYIYTVKLYKFRCDHLFSRLDYGFYIYTKNNIAHRESELLLFLKIVATHHEHPCR